FAKAFDSVDHGIILAKLKQLGVCGRILEWFKDYLTDRTQRVVIDDVTSNTNGIITKAKISELERQRKTLDDKLQEVHDLKLRIQEAKLREGVKPEEVRAWTDETKANDIVPIEEAISELETVITTTKGKELRRKENLAAQ
ncbi:Hypothetical predicted protein, partial [Paramuricea clavata]